MRDDFDLEAGLKRLHLPTVRRVYLELQEQAEKEGWSYRDFLSRLVGEELAHRAQVGALTPWSGEPLLRHQQPPRRGGHRSAHWLHESHLS